MPCVLTALLLACPDCWRTWGKFPGFWQRSKKPRTSCIDGTMSVRCLQLRIEYSVRVSLKRNVLFTFSLALWMVIPLGIASCRFVFPWHTQIRSVLEFRAQFQHYRNNSGFFFSWLNNSAVLQRETKHRTQLHIFNVKQASSGKEKVAASFRDSSFIVHYQGRAVIIHTITRIHSYCYQWN